jgi:hypothetical protein
MLFAIIAEIIKKSFQKYFKEIISSKKALLG